MTNELRTRLSVSAPVACAAIAACLLAQSALARQQARTVLKPITPLTPLSGTDPCTRCFGYLLPGRAEPNPDATYRIDSDLPEMLMSTGVLYSTAPVIPEFLTKAGEPVIESQRRQRNLGFTTIDDRFEVFVYHLNYEGQAPRSRRVLVHARNMGDAPVTIKPRQIMESRGVMAKADGPESRMSVRMLADRWDRPMERVTIPPGEGRVIGWSPRLSVPDAPAEDLDVSNSDFFTGMVQGEFEHDASTNGKPSLEVAVVAIDAAVPREGFDRACVETMARGAQSGEEGMDLQIPPPQCHVRRVGGVSRSFLWRSEEMVIDVTNLPKDSKPFGPAGLSFLMAAPAVQTRDCPQARQTGDMLLHPGYVHPDTIGNYQVEYLVTLTLVNPATSGNAALVDLRFGKHDADVGLAWQFQMGKSPATREQLMSRPRFVQWAGPWRKDDLADDTRSFFAPVKGLVEEPAIESPVALVPGERTTVTLRFMPVGTSSLPFHIHVVPVKPTLSIPTAVPVAEP
jgi:hypothetical protein